MTGFAYLAAASIVVCIFWVYCFCWCWRFYRLTNERLQSGRRACNKLVGELFTYRIYLARLENELRNPDDGIGRVFLTVDRMKNSLYGDSMRYAEQQLKEAAGEPTKGLML